MVCGLAVVFLTNSNVSLAQEEKEERSIDPVSSLVNGSHVFATSSNEYLGNVKIPNDLSLLLDTNSSNDSIELVNDQREQLRKIMFDYVRSMQSAQAMESVKRIQVEKETSTKLESDIKSVLLPFQAKAWNAKLVVRSGLPETLCNSNLFVGLNLDESQKLKLREKSNEVANRFEEKLLQLKRDAYDEVLETLTKKQQATYHEMVDSEEIERIISRLPTEFLLNQLKTKKK